MDKLFDTDIPDLVWQEFKARGYSSAAGLIYHSARPACCGVPLGGIGTGCLNIETTGVLGLNTTLPARFQHPEEYSVDSRRKQHLLPFLGIEAAGRVFVLTTQKYIDGGTIEGCGNAMYMAGDGFNRNFIEVPHIEGVEAAKEIYYWGHYPVADIEYDIDSPVSVGLRAWSSFIPGDLAASGIPGAVFEVHLRNLSVKEQKGTLALSYPGTSAVSPGMISREDLHGDLEGISVTSKEKNIGYVLGVLNEKNVRCGLGLSSSPDSWSKIGYSLPQASIETTGSDTKTADISSSVAVGYVLKPHGSEIVRYILAWHAPDWLGGTYADTRIFDWADMYTDEEYEKNLGSWENGFLKDAPAVFTEQLRNKENRVKYSAMYACRFADAAETALKLAEKHEILLKRILSWQQEIYMETELPVWMRDVLVNNLCLITQTGYWAQPKGQIGDWSFPEGAFGMVESPRTCNVMGCIASNWYGDLPLVYFFPELEKMIIRNYCRYMREDGAIPFLFPDGDFTKPAYEWQLLLNGACFAFIADRYWQCTGDDAFLRETYPFVKRSVDFVMTIDPAPEGIISVYRAGKGQEWWEWEPVCGRVSHLGGVHLAALRIAERMASSVGDNEFSSMCGRWFSQGSSLLEDTMWKDDRYLWYYDPKTGRASDMICSCMLDGDWTVKHHGLPPVFREDRSLKYLDAIKKACFCGCGLASFGSAEDGPFLTMYGNYVPANIIAAMTFMYGGEKELGLEIARRIMHNLYCGQRHPWDLPNEVSCETGERRFGTNYYQNMVAWSLPAAMSDKPQNAICGTGGFADRIIKAGKELENEVIDRMYIDDSKLFYKRNRKAR